MYTATKLRKTFIDYFVSKDHKVIESSSVIPTSDKSLLFVNSGMVQFKKLFTSEVSDFSGFKELRRAVSVQRCVRAGGKHNDLDDVGMDNYHHTYFEMLGNWSFGDYFKAEAVDFAYDFLVNVLKLEKTKLYVTYFRPQCSKGWHSKEYRPDKCPSTGISEDSGNGDNYKQLFDEDLETKSLWMKYFPENRILPFEKENFWEMGDTGPCGPCTEIHYDRIGNRDASSLVNKDDPDVIEIWNIVFMEYCRSEQGFTPLKKKCIDTGMGLERVLSILNGVRSNYMIESFTRIFDFLREKYNLPEYSEPENKNIEITDSRNAGAEDTDFKDTTNEDTDLKGTNNEGTDLKGTTNQDTDLKGATNQDTDLKDINVIDKNLKNMTIRPRKDQTIIAYRIIADHCRTISVCLYDGVEFSSEGRGYVLRRITRRAIRYLHDIFNLANGELSKICNFVSQHLHLSLSERHLRMIDDEENLFLKTLEKGKIYFNKITKNGILSGYDIFILHDTYGFPVDLSIIMANENKIDVNVGDYERYKEQAKERSRKKEIDGLKVELNDLEKYAITDDKYKYMILDGEYVITDDRGKFTIFDDQYKHSFCRDQNRYEIVDDDQYRDTISGNYIRHTFPHNQNRHAIVSDKKYKHSMPEFGLTSNVLCVVAQNKVIDIDDIECINTQNGVPESKIGVICDKTCFYAEKGGQVGDQGIIYFLHTNEKGISELSGKLDVEHTKNIGNYVIHIGHIEGKFSKTARMEVDIPKRMKIMKNHTATHILNYVLRFLYGCEQNGSFLNHEKLRFDFTFQSDIAINGIADIKRIEDKVNELINMKLDVTTELKEYGEVKDAICLKGERYPSIVRVVNISHGYSNTGEMNETNTEKLKIFNQNNPQLTRKSSTSAAKIAKISELCGGTHVKNTGDIKMFRIVSCTSISSTTRRIVGVTDEAAICISEKAQKVIEDCRKGIIFKNIDLLGDIPAVDREMIDHLNKINEKKNIANWKNKIADIKEKLKVIESKTIIFRAEKCSENILKDLNAISSVVSREKSLFVYTTDCKDFYFLARNCEIKVVDLERFGNVRAGGKMFLMGKVENVSDMEALITFIKGKIEERSKEVD